MRALDFFASNPVFTTEDFMRAHTGGGRSAHTSANLLANHVATGRLLRVRRGLYATVPRGVEPENANVDPYLVATRLTDDAVVAFHAALQFHGKVYSLWSRLHYLSRGRARRFSFRGVDFVPVQAPLPVRSMADMGGGVVEERHAGGRVRVCTLERCLVDVLAAPDKCGGWEEVWRSLEMVEFFDLDAVVDYTLKLGSALTTARVGFYLEQHREVLMVEDQHLKPLRARAPRQPRYLDSSRQHGKLVTGWNLVVPDVVIERAWQEVP